MNNNFLTTIKEAWSRGVVAMAALWLLCWAGYNTGIERVLAVGFPHSTLDFIHGMRAFLPLVAGGFSCLILYVKRKQLKLSLFATPLGLLLAYALVGIISAFLSKSVVQALYWDFMYASLLVVLLPTMLFKNSKDILRGIMVVNWCIAAVLALGLVVIFLLQPGVIHSLTFNVLVCVQRPYEHIADVAAGQEILGMPSTRPTGLGRYAGVIALLAFWRFLHAKKRKKWGWLGAFIVFLAILFFSKGKTEMLAFIVAIVAMVYLGKKITRSVTLTIIGIVIVSAVIILFNVPCTNSLRDITAYVTSLMPKISVSHRSPLNSHQVTVIQQSPVKKLSLQSPISTSQQISEPATVSISNPSPTPSSNSAINQTSDKTLQKVLTLSGRTTGIWPELWHLFLMSPLLGHGFQADRFFLDGQHAHNTLLHALVQTGILGTIPLVVGYIMLLMMALVVLKSSRVTSQEKIFFIELLGILTFFLVRGFTESLAFYSADWLFVAPIIAYMQWQYFQVRQYPSKEAVIHFSGNTINMITMPEAIETMSQWIQKKVLPPKWMVVTGMHGVVQSHKNPEFKRMVNTADVFVPDGISLVLVGKLHGFDISSRVSGADLMEAFFAEAEKKGYISYFYGDTNETLHELQKKLLGKFPNLKIAGMYSPPFRKLSEQEDKEIIKKINAAKPDVVWVGLGLPKQEAWIFNHKNVLNVSVVVGVGAAFKFLSQKVKRAPAWVGKLGFEWLWRLIFETKTTIRRILWESPIFLWLVFLDIFK